MHRAIAVTRTCNVGFETAADLLAIDAVVVLRLATDAAVAETNDIVLNLVSKWAWFDVHEPVRADVGELSRTRYEVLVLLSWVADRRRRLLPAVTGHLSVTAISSRHTEVGFVGDYSPPTGLLPSVDERVLGRRVVDAAIGRFLDKVVAHLEQQRPVLAVVR